MAETSKNKIYYNDDENSVADVLTDMKKLAQSTDDAIEKSKYNDTQIKKDISNMKTEIAAKDNEQDNKILQLQTEKAELEKELKEMQEDFYQNSIRGQASGEYIHVEDSSNCRSIIGICGNHEQETRSGKNKYNGNDFTTGGWSVSFTNLTNLVNSLAVGDYTISFDVEIASITKEDTRSYLSQISYTTEDVLPKKDYSLTFPAKNVGSKVHFSFQINITNETAGKYSFILYTMGNHNVGPCGSSTYKNIQVELGTQETSYEQYGAMPSPDYLSEIKTVGDNVNIFDKEKYRNINNWSNSQGFFICCKLDEEDTEKFKKIITGSISLKGKLQNLVFGISTTNSASSFNNQYRMLDNGTIKNITYDFSNAENIYLCIGNANKIGIDKNEINLIFDNYNIKFEEGTVATPWSQYGQGCVKVTKCNKNILKNIATSGNLNGVTRTVNEDGSVTINGTSTGWANLTVGTIKGDGNSYTLSGSLSNSEIFLSVNNSQDGDIAQSKNGNEITFIPKKGLTYNVIICIPSGKTFNNVLIKPLVRISSDKDNTFEQHEEQSYIMPVQQEMLEGDTFDYNNEEEVHTWGKLVLNGTEKIGISGASTDEILAVVYDINNAIDGFGYSNCFLYSSQVALNKLNVYNNGKNLRVCVDKSKLVDLESFKSKIIELYNAGTPVMIYYKLATPTRLAFTDEQKAVAKELNNARTYKNVTNITTDSKAILSLDYVKDQETQNQKMQNEIYEIKQLLSTTQTSAMLLDNLQKEVESEVE